MMKTLTLASIYEIQGYKHEATEIYKTILQGDPNNAEAKIALRRLMSDRKSYGKADVAMLNLFVQMDSEVEFNEFERWLLQVWS
ncbi:hypothetical protein CDV25_06765 [Helicobacter apodemus]|uniref:Tetratricopeptide repeat protein n=2 Tax=Helicobacter apodemus TaxID=135569 RepID=A0A2U8FED3_9HELI|nr:hypothetical protein CDV25_06765 [Helicobacter apodemus]